VTHRAETGAGIAPSINVDWPRAYVFLLLNLLLIVVRRRVCQAFASCC
jgi:hypothetical protein